jgi:hypothetical protein
LTTMANTPSWSRFKWELAHRAHGCHDVLDALY